jgi:Outer membrane protein beta-barrel domain
MAKKLIFILFPFLLFPAISFSQFFEGGAVAGLSASQVDGDTYSGFNKLGLLAGGWVRHMFTYTVGGQLEVRYIMKGASRIENVDNAIYYKLTLHYGDVPILINYHYRERVLFEIGLSPEFLFTSREQEDVNGNSPEDAPPFHRLTMSAIGGIGYTFLEKFMVDVRYNYSVIPIRDHPSGQTYLLNRGQYSNVLTFSLYYQITK